MKANLRRPFSFWLIFVFLILSMVLLVLGQSMAVFDYETAVQLGLQEDIKAIGEFGVEVNRGFGAGDTLIYLPLIILSSFGLWYKKRWALIVTGSVMGISMYWSVTVAFMFLFLKDTPGYIFVPTIGYWFVIGSYLFFGLWALFYMLLHGDRLIQ